MRINKRLMFVSGICIVCGAAIAGTAYIIMSRTYDRNIRMRTQEITEDISNINIAVNMSDIKIITSDTDKIVLTYFTDDTNKYDISADNGSLSIEYIKYKKNKAKWYDYYLSFGFNRNHDMILELPQKLNADIKLNTEYGDIQIMGIKGENINAHTSYGDLEVSRCTFNSMEYSTDYGDIEIDYCNGDTMNCNTDYGDIELGSSSCNVNCHTDYGDVYIDRILGSNIIMNTDCGDIEGTIVGNELDYTITASTNIGDNNITNRVGGKNILDLKTDMGEIDVEFVK